MQEGESSVAPCPGDSGSPSTPGQLHIRQLMRLERSCAAFPFPEAMEELSHPCPTPSAPASHPGCESAVGAIQAKLAAPFPVPGQPQKGLSPLTRTQREKPHPLTEKDGAEGWFSSPGAGYVREGRATEMGVAGGMCVCKAGLVCNGAQGCASEGVGVRAGAGHTRGHA